ncbi:MAG: DUF4129 domain-containing protein [Terriglobales bacterium]
MTWRRLISVSLCVCAVAAIAAAQATTSPPALTIPDYIAQLDKLDAATAELRGNPARATTLANETPSQWQIADSGRKFQISTEPLKFHLRVFAKNADLRALSALRSQIDHLRSQAAEFMKAPEDVSRARTHLKEILARREFRRVHGPSWWDRVQRRIAETLLRFVERVLGASATRNVTKVFVWSLVGVAVLALAIWMYRILRRGSQLESIALGPLPVSAKQWPVRLAEARAAADRSAWRDAVHLAYWAGISFLEERGMWRPDRARTPREYLSLLPEQSEQRPPLFTLTRQFEAVWYGYREAGPAAFRETVAQLEKLGCRCD